jgi:hypothetical protein
MHKLPKLFILYLFVLLCRTIPSSKGSQTTYQLEGDVKPEDVVALLRKEFPQAKVVHLGENITTIASSIAQDELKLAEALEKTKLECVTKYAVKDYIPR